MVKVNVKQAFSIAASSALILGTAIMPVAAEDVRLRSEDGKISLIGDLVGYTNGEYVLQTEDFGLMRVNRSGMTCDGATCPELVAFGPEFGIYGSRTVGTTLIPSLLQGYAKSVGATYEISPTADPAERIVRLINADGSLRAEIDLQTRGSGSAFPALAEGKAAIGVADRRMKDSDLAKLAKGNIGELRDTANEQVLGLDGIVMITHPDNPVRNLSSLDVARIWSGEVTNWREFGGGDVPIKVNSFGEGSGDRAVMMDALVRPNGRDETAPVTRFKAYQDMVDSVMEDRGGIGFVGRWLARTNDVNLLDIRETCGLLSPPTDFRMKIEGYALSRRLYAYTPPGNVHPEAAAFLEWTRTTDAQPYIKAANFVDRDLERMRLEDMGMMLVHTAAVEPDFDGNQYSDMMRNLRGADRLSTSFRFEFGSSNLDVESIRNVEEIGQRMLDGEFDGMEVMLVGFADSVGNVQKNTSLAYRRALAVRDIMVKSLPSEAVNRLKLAPLSYGELLPLSCNDTDIGRERNRRVELWLRVSQPTG